MRAGVVRRVWHCDLNRSNRPVRTRMPGGVGGAGHYWLPLSRFPGRFFASNVKFIGIRRYSSSDSCMNAEEYGHSIDVQESSS
jgi:hypothetical protein